MSTLRTLIFSFIYDQPRTFDDAAKILQNIPTNLEFEITYYPKNIDLTIEFSDPDVSEHI